MEVLIFTEGGATKGFGHLARCAALEVAFLEQGDCVSVVFSGPESAKSFFCFPSPENFEWSANPLRCRQLLLGRDVLIFDSYQPQASFYKEVLEGFEGILVFFDDDDRICYPSGILINGALDSGSLYPSTQAGQERLLGPYWQPLRLAFQQCQTIKVVSVPKRVLVTLGGDDIRSLAPFLYDQLTKDFPMWIFTFVSTSVSRTYHELENQIRSPHRLVVDIDDKVMLQEMLSSDLAVTAAGQTTYETARVGLPVILIQVAENQTRLVSSWLHSGYVLRAISWQQATSPGLVAEALETLKPFSIRRRLSDIGTSHVDGLGAQRIAFRVKERWRNDFTSKGTP